MVDKDKPKGMLGIVGPDKTMTPMGATLWNLIDKANVGNFFPKCKYRAADHCYTCQNKDAKLFGQPCSKRCTENVPYE